MPTPGWVNSDRRATLPPNWRHLVAYVKNRALGRCECPGSHPERVATYTGTRCRMAGSDCDHIAGRDDHRVENLQWLCEYHHQVKTINDRRTRRRSDRRPPERHPGLRGKNSNGTHTQAAARPRPR